MLDLVAFVRTDVSEEHSAKPSALTRATQRNIPEDGILHNEINVYIITFLKLKFLRQRKHNICTADNTRVMPVTDKFPFKNCYEPAVSGRNEDFALCQIKRYTRILPIRIRFIFRYYKKRKGTQCLGMWIYFIPLVPKRRCL
jgi:hypothetical protein